MSKIKTAFWMLLFYAVTGSTQPNVNISGFVDGTYLHDNTSAASFRVSQVEVDVEHKSDKTGVRFDIDSTNSLGGSLATPGDSNIEVEQAYVEIYNILKKENLNFQFGKFNAPIGGEPLDPPELFPITHSLLFGALRPVNVSGAMFTKKIGEERELKLYVANKWDSNVDNNEAKIFGTRFGLTKEKHTCGFSAIWGAEKGASGDKRIILDSDWTITPSEEWTFGGEINWGREEGKRADIPVFQWFGLQGFARKQINEATGIYGRFDLLKTDDADTTTYGLTFAADQKHDEHTTSTLEATLRHTDTPGAFVPKKNYLQIGYEITYQF